MLLNVPECITSYVSGSSSRLPPRSCVTGKFLSRHQQILFYISTFVLVSTLVLFFPPVIIRQLFRHLTSDIRVLLNVILTEVKLSSDDDDNDVFLIVGSS